MANINNPAPDEKCRMIKECVTLTAAAMFNQPLKMTADSSGEAVTNYTMNMHPTFPWVTYS